MKQLIFLICLCFSGALFAQDIMSLYQLRREAETNYPNLAKSDLLLPEYENTIRNLNAGYLPGIDIGGRASWQSDVTTIAFEQASDDVPFNIEDIVTIPEMRKDNYRIALDISQVIWDGGMIKHAREVEKAALEVSMKQYEVEIYSVGNAVNDLFFSLLMLKEKEKVLFLTLDELNSRKESMESAIKNGVVASWNADVLTAEILQIEQQIEANGAQIQGVIDATNILTGKQYPYDAVPVLPDIDISLAVERISRPELQVFDAGIDRLKASEGLIYRKRMPVVAGFGQAGYGLPGLNMFSTEFQPWAMAGITFKWKLWDWKQNRRQRLNLQVNQAIMTLEKETVRQKFLQAAALKNAQISQYEKMLIKDDEIIAMRSKVKLAAARQLEEGTITSTSYITEMNREKQAVLDRQIHKILLIQSKVEFLQTTGAINESLKK
jgi:outer membrane protein TolC